LSVAALGLLVDVHQPAVIALFPELLARALERRRP
jgi:hypothetical protein